jgi:hypothetical protein
MEIEMNKVKLEFKAPSSKTITYNGVDFQVTTLLDMPMMAFLINRYIQEYFTKTETSIVKEAETDYFGAEFGLKNYILQMCTNVDANDFDNSLYTEPRLWKEITSAIINYDEFRDTLAYILGEVKAQRASELSRKFLKIMDGVGEINGAELEKLQDQAIELTKTIDQSSILKDVGKLEKQS